MRSRRFLPLLFGIIGCLAFLGPGGPGRADPDDEALRLEGALVQLLRVDASQVRAWAARRGIGLDPAGRGVHVVIEPQGGQMRALPTSAIEALGGVITARGAHRASARLPLAHLRRISELPGIAFVRRPYHAWPLELPRYQMGALPTGALLMQSFGFNGQGVNVAVIDQGFEGLGEALRRDWIAPGAVIRAIDYSGRGLESGGDHGTRVARIVHEMAPGAGLILMNLGEEADEVLLERAVEDALALGARVINHSLGWFDTNFGDGTGVIDDIAKGAAQRGVLWVNAAGNQAQRHWTGRFFDRNGDGWAEFGSGRDALIVGAAPAREGGIFIGGTFGLIELVLVWDDWPRTGQDLDLYLVDGRGEVVASATAPQRGLDPPREHLQYLVEEPGIFKLRVKAVNVTRPPHLKIFSLNHDVTPNVPYGSVIAPADCACAVAAGAVSLRRWEEGVVEPFSARGPTSDGRIKPDLVAPDGVRGFYGTSAAAPHVAGAAALLRSQHPEWTLDRLRRVLEGDALDIYARGPDVLSGHGKLLLQADRPRAIRSLSKADVEPGESVMVTITARMPASQFGSLTLTERPPPGFVLAPPESTASEAGFDVEDGGRTYRWRWGPLGPGDVREASYRLIVPSHIEPGRYRLEGDLDGRPVAGEAWLRVRPVPSLSGTPPPPSLAIRASAGAIDYRILGDSLPQGARWRARLFDLAGRERVASSLTDRRALTLLPERRLAHGVYVTVITVRGPDGGARHEVRKLVVLR